MDIDAIRKRCLSFPHTTEQVQWGADLVFKVDGKMFAVVPLEVARTKISFKCSPENFIELCEREGIIPAPYMARAQWIALETLDALTVLELQELLAESYRLVWEKLPKKRREALAAEVTKSTKMSAKGPTKTRPKRATKKKAPGRRG
jgi:predicted DNA-binding protein (MmcQ/YjbR family)